MQGRMMCKSKDVHTEQIQYPQVYPSKSCIFSLLAAPECVPALMGMSLFHKNNIAITYKYYLSQGDMTVILSFLIQRLARKVRYDAIL